MSHKLTFLEIKKEWHGSMRSYVIGFVLSLLLTGIAFFLVYQRLLPTPLLILTIIGLAILQALVQLFFFLHVGAEAKPHWQTITCLFMVLVLLIVVAGSFWVMHDLENRMMGEMPTMEQHSHD